MKNYLIIALALFSGVASAAWNNTNSYQTISEMKVFDDEANIYLKNGEQHRCSGGHKTRFVMDDIKDTPRKKS